MKEKIPHSEVMTWLTVNHPDLAPKAELDRSWVWLKADLRSDCEKARKRECQCQACKAATEKREAISEFGFRYARRGHQLPSGQVGTWGHSCDRPKPFRGKGGPKPQQPTKSGGKPSKQTEAQPSVGRRVDPLASQTQPAPPAFDETDALALAFASGNL